MRIKLANTALHHVIIQDQGGESRRVKCLQHTSRENGKQSDSLRTSHLEPKHHSNWQQQDIDISHAIKDGVDDNTLPQCSAKV